MEMTTDQYEEMVDRMIANGIDMEERCEDCGKYLDRECECLERGDDGLGERNFEAEAQEARYESPDPTPYVSPMDEHRGDPEDWECMAGEDTRKSLKVFCPSCEKNFPDHETSSVKDFDGREYLVCLKCATTKAWAWSEAGDEHTLAHADDEPLYDYLEIAPPSDDDGLDGISNDIYPDPDDLLVPTDLGGRE